MSSSIARAPDRWVQNLLTTQSEPQIKKDDFFPKVLLKRYNAHNQQETFFSDDSLMNLTVVFTVNGAWMKSSDQQLKEFLAAADTILNLGVNNIVCVTPDKLDVAINWSQIQGDPTKIEILADDRNELTLETGLGLNLSDDSAQGLGMKHAVFVIYQCYVEWMHVEELQTDSNVSLASRAVTYLQTRPNEDDEMS